MACTGMWSCISLSSPPPLFPPNLYQIINKFELLIIVMRYSESSVCKYMHNYIVASMKPQGNQKGLKYTQCNHSEIYPSSVYIHLYIADSLTVVQEHIPCMAGPSENFLDIC